MKCVGQNNLVGHWYIDVLSTHSWTSLIYEPALILE